MLTAGELWVTAAALLRSQVSDGVWQSTFAQVAPIELADDTFILAMPNGIIRDRLDGRYRPLVEDAVAEAAGYDLKIDFRLVVPTLFDDAEGHIDLTGEDNRFDRRAPGAGDGRTQTLTGRLGEPSIPSTSSTSQRVHGGVHADRSAGRRPDGMGTDPLHIGTPLRRDPLQDGSLAGIDGNGIDISGAPESASIGVELANRYTFKNFVTGPSNRFAIAAALSVAERPGGSYNPLFIYGSAGLGKTHILRAIEHFINDLEPQKKVLYVSTETFLNEFVDSIKNSSGNDFKRRYRQIDVLLVDDIQFIEGKDRLQEELFHTFNDLYGSNRQIVLSSDRPPDAIPTLEERLRSRFMMGLLTDIQPPDIETRMAILRKKAERDGIPLPNDVSEFIAANITNNIRELEGALNKVTAFANLNGETMTTALAEQVLGDFIADRQPRPITAAMILEATVEQFGFTLEELTGKSRRRPLVIARQMAMYVTRQLTDLSFPLIAKEFGGRDHTTVMHACDKISALMKERSQIYNHVMALEKTVRNQAHAGEY
ncbi:MAG: chromosomal replication initiator protein DnaA [Acidimicrobiales bacterium]